MTKVMDVMSETRLQNIDCRVGTLSALLLGLL